MRGRLPRLNRFRPTLRSPGDLLSERMARRKFSLDPRPAGYVGPVASARDHRPRRLPEAPEVLAVTERDQLLMIEFLPV